MSPHTNARSTIGLDSDLVVYESKKRVLGWMSLCCVCSFAGWLISLLPVSPTRSGGRAAEYLAASIFLVIAITLVPNLLTSKPKLVVSDAGIYLRSRKFGSGVVQWQDISMLVAYSYYGVTLFAIHVVSPEVIAARQNRLQRILYVLSGWPLIGPTRMSMTDILDMPISDLLEQIRERYHRELAHYHVHIINTSQK